MITCILLSAGLSQRFGSPKALATIDGRTIIERLQKTLLQARVDEIIVILGAHADKITPSIVIHSRIRVVYNKDYYLGQTSSVQAGWREIKNAEGIMFLPVDCPLVKTSSVDAVINEFKQNKPDILIPSYQGKKGHPPIFHQHLTPKILGIPTYQGLNSIFADHPPQTIEINDNGIVKSFNTPEELKEIISRQ